MATQFNLKMISGEHLTRILIWVGLLGYGLTVVALLLGRPHLRSIARWCWSLGLLAYLGHVAAAFHYYYQWSHEIGIAETARQTRELTGHDSGGGLYLNYLFTVVWIADTAYWWVVGLSSYARRPGWVDWIVHGFFVFMIVNGAVVFGQGPVRWLGAGILLLPLCLGVYVKRRKSRGIGP
jgi:hypothetical protein